MGPTGDATLPMLLADSEATLGETGGALDTAIEQIALWVGQQLHDTQTSLTSVKAKLTKWANKALQTTGATINDVVAALQQNAAAYVDPHAVPPPSGVSVSYPTVAPSQQQAPNPAPSTLTDTSPQTFAGQECGRTWTVASDPSIPPIPTPIGYHWVLSGNVGSGMQEWICVPFSNVTPGGGISTGGMGGQQGMLLSGIPSGQTCLRYRLDGSCATYPEACISPSPAAPYTDWEELYWTDPTVNGTANNTAGFYSATFAAQSVDGQCLAAAGGSLTPVTVTAPTPCELPPDIASWPGQRVVQIPYDLNQGGEASAIGECGQLMLKDAVGRFYPVQVFLDAFASDDPYKAMLPDMRGWSESRLGGEAREAK